MQKSLMAACVVFAVTFGHIVETQARSRGAAVRPDVVQLVNQVADAHGVPRNIAHGVVKTESGYDCRAKSDHSTALGIMQVVRGTARAVGVSGDLRDCRTGLEAGMRYLKAAITRAGPTCAGVSLYNEGIGARPRCTAYGKKVMRFARQ